MEAYKLFQMGVAYTQSLLSYHSNLSPHPFSAAFSITNRCNLKCLYCNLPNMKAPELSLEEIEFLFRKLKKMGVVRLGLFGGEPLVRKDLGEILLLAKKMGFYISLNSNLLLYNRYKDVLDPVDYFFTSLDGNAEKQIANRGKHNYDDIIEAIRDIVKRRKKITAICVVTDPDISSADYLIDLAVREKIDIHFQPECYDSECAGRDAPEELEQQATRDYWRYLLKKKKQGAPISSSTGYLEYISKWDNYKITSIYDSKQKCAAGSGFVFIDPSGIAYPCIFVKDRIKGIDLMKYDWADRFNKTTPCTKCIVGPLLEFNLLYHKPISSVIAALNKA